MRSATVSKLREVDARLDRLRMELKRGCKPVLSAHFVEPSHVIVEGPLLIKGV